MKSKQRKLNKRAGAYYRLSRDDDQPNESLSIDNQRKILTRYIEENDLELVDEYIDDGISGTTFNRPSVQRLLEDAKNGRIDTIIVKDLSRFGRNYIEVGMYLDYIFPSYGIRFIALTDNIDTADKDSSAMEMMPIMNVFNEWHAANTSKKIRSVFEMKAKMGIYMTTYAAYGYKKGEGERRLPIFDEAVSGNVHRIFEMRASGLGPRKIAAIFTREGIDNPMYYRHKVYGAKIYKGVKNIWSPQTVKQILGNPIYRGHLAQLRQTTISYKNKKNVKRAQDEWVIIENSHPAIIEQELWDKVREVDASVSRGKITKQGVVKPLSGLIYCPECGAKMRVLATNVVIKGEKTGEKRWGYNCAAFMQMGKLKCNSKYIQEDIISEIVLQDIRSKAKLVICDEEKARSEFLKRKAKISMEQHRAETKRLNIAEKRLDELNRLLQSVYEDKVFGKIPEEVCAELIRKYQTERNEVAEEVEVLREKLSEVKNDEADVDEFIRRVKNYVAVKKLTREMCLELIEFITIGHAPKSKNEPREVHIYYKLLDKETAEERRNKIKGIAA